MKRNFVNRDDIIGTMAASLNLKKTEIKPVLLEIEKVITEGLKNQGRVKLKDLGSFYILERKSRTIKEIRSRKARLLLQRKALKFIAAEALKSALMGRPRRIRAPKATPSEAFRQPAAKKIDIFEKEITPSASAGYKRIELKPLHINFPVDKEKNRRQILERLKKVAQMQANIKPKTKATDNLPTRLRLSDTAEGKVFAALIKQLMENGGDYFHFVLEPTETIFIFHGKPRQIIAKVPAVVAVKFLESYFEIADFDLPQERFVKIIIDDKIDNSHWLYVHSLPTISGASIYIKLRI